MEFSRRVKCSFDNVRQSEECQGGGGMKELVECLDTFDLKAGNLAKFRIIGNQIRIISLQLV